MSCHVPVSKEKKKHLEIFFQILILFNIPHPNIFLHSTGKPLNKKEKVETDCDLNIFMFKR